MKQLLAWLVALSIAIPAFTGMANAQQRGTAAEAKQLLQDAVAHVKQVGPEQAFADFSAGGKWLKKDIYLFCYKYDGTCVCQGSNKALVGKNLIDLKYPDGKTHMRDMLEMVKTKGSGTDEYPWPDPITKKIETKQVWVAKVPGYDGLIGVGIFK